jgi:hypothetical protein
MENAAYIVVMFIVEKGVHCVAFEGRLLSYVLNILLKKEFLIKRKRKKMTNVTLIV